MYQKSKTELSALIFIFFLVDILSGAFFEQPFVQALICLYLVLILRTPTLGIFHVMSVMLLALESFLWYGRYDIALAFLVPATVCAAKARDYFEVIIPAYYALLVAWLGAKFFIVEGYFLHTVVQGPFILISLTLNFFILWYLLKKILPVRKKKHTLY